MSLREAKLSKGQQPTALYLLSCPLLEGKVIHNVGRVCQMRRFGLLGEQSLQQAPPALCATSAGGGQYGTESIYFYL